jgi:hypothetical protein
MSDFTIPTVAKQGLLLVIPHFFHITCKVRIGQKSKASE